MSLLLLSLLLLLLSLLLLLLLLLFLSLSLLLLLFSLLLFLLPLLCLLLSLSSCWCCCLRLECPWLEEPRNSLRALWLVRDAGEVLCLVCQLPRSTGACHHILQLGR